MDFIDSHERGALANLWEKMFYKLLKLQNEVCIVIDI